MKKALSALSLCLAVALISTPALADGNLNFSLGQRSLDDNDFAPVDDQTYFGATLDWDMSWPVNLAGSLYYSKDEDSIGSTDLSARVIEATFGIQKTWGETSNMHPFLGGGLGIVNVEAEIDDPLFGSASEDDTAPALYTEGGIYWTLSHSFNLGVSGRFMTAPGVEIAGEDFNTSYFQVGILAGWAFSK